MVDKTEKALYDKMQTRLGKDLKPIPNTFKFAKKNLEDIIKNKMCLCPFCLNAFYLSQFTFDKGLYKCKNCENKISDKTLINMFNWFNSPQINIEEFAKWVFNYRLNGFFQKVKPNFKEWTHKLYDLGISQEFWDNYKRLKGENKKDYEDYE